MFVGVAAEGLDQEEQAVMAYTKATQVDPQQQLAWQVGGMSLAKDRCYNIKGKSNCLESRYPRPSMFS